MRKEFLAVCAASKIIINKCRENLMEHIQPCTGDIYGVCGVSLGAVTAQGYIQFLGVKMRCYLAETEVSVFSIGESCLYHGFRWTLEGFKCKVVSLRTVDAAVIPIQEEETCTQSH